MTTILPDEISLIYASDCSLEIRDVRLFLLFTFSLLVGISFSTLLGADDGMIPAPLQQFEQQVQRIGKVQAESVVVIAAVAMTEKQQTPTERFVTLFKPRASQFPSRLGMGVVVESNDEQLLILTTSHLVEPLARPGLKFQSAELLVKFSSNQVHLAKVLAADPRSELAILQVAIDSSEEHAHHPSAIELPENLSLAKGSILVAVGNPWEMARDGSASMAATVITNSHRSSIINPQTPLSERTLHDLGTLLELDLPSRLTASGTVLLTLEGQFAGLVHSQSLPQANGDSVSYAIPMSRGFVRIIEELKQGLEVEYGFLGVSSETSPPDALSGVSLAGPQVSGALVIRVPQNSPAEKAGIIREDILLRVNDVLVDTSEDLVREIGLLKPETDAELVLFRNGDGVRSVTVTLGKWPVYDDTFLYITRDRYPAWRGMQVDFSTGRRRYLRDRFLGAFPNGVAVSAVTPEGIADLAGLQVGQFIVKVNGQPVETPQQFHAAIEHNQGEVQLTLANEIEVILPVK